MTGDWWWFSDPRAGYIRVSSCGRVLMQHYSLTFSLFFYSTGMSRSMSGLFFAYTLIIIQCMYRSAYNAPFFVLSTLKTKKTLLPHILDIREWRCWCVSPCWVLAYSKIFPLPILNSTVWNPVSNYRRHTDPEAVLENNVIRKSRLYMLKF